MAETNDSLSHTKWDCKYHIVFIPKCRRAVLYRELRKYLGEMFRCELKLCNQSLYMKTAMSNKRAYGSVRSSLSILASLVTVESEAIETKELRSYERRENREAFFEIASTGRSESQTEGEVQCK